MLPDTPEEIAAHVAALRTWLACMGATVNDRREATYGGCVVDVSAATSETAISVFIAGIIDQSFEMGRKVARIELRNAIGIFE